MSSWAKALLQTEELARILSETQLKVSEVTSKGVVESFALLVTEDGVEHRTNEPWCRVSLFNDGPNSVYVGVNSESILDRGEVRNGEPLIVDFENSKKKIDFLYLICLPGETASVRTFTKR